MYPSILRHLVLLKHRKISNQTINIILSRSNKIKCMFIQLLPLSIKFLNIEYLHGNKIIDWEYIRQEECWDSIEYNNKFRKWMFIYNLIYLLSKSDTDFIFIACSLLDLHFGWLHLHLFVMGNFWILILFIL